MRAPGWPQNRYYVGRDRNIGLEPKTERVVGPRDVNLPLGSSLQWFSEVFPQHLHPSDTS